jgi:uncharacterized protein Yka (UPF0111/DUF47 family)
LKRGLKLAKAQKSFDYFQNQFEKVGKNLNKAQEAFETGQRHLKTYRDRVTALSGQEQLERMRPRRRMTMKKERCPWRIRRARDADHRVQILLPLTWA